MKTKVIFLLMLLFSVALLSCNRDFIIDDPIEDPVTKYSVEIFTSDGGTTNPSGIISVTKGSNLDLNIIENPGFIKDSIVVNGVSYPLATNVYRIDDISADLKIKPIFKRVEVDSFKIEVIAGPGGKVTPSGMISVIEGSSLTFDIISDPGFEPDSVVVNGVSSPLTSSTSYTLLNINSNIKKVEFFFKKTIVWSLMDNRWQLDTIAQKQVYGDIWSQYPVEYPDVTIFNSDGSYLVFRDSINIGDGHWYLVGDSTISINGGQNNWIIEKLDSGVLWLGRYDIEYAPDPSIRTAMIKKFKKI